MDFRTGRDLIDHLIQPLNVIDERNDLQRNKIPCVYIYLVSRQARIKTQLEAYSKVVKIMVFKKTVVHLPNGILSSRKKEGTPTLHNSLDGTGEHCAK